MKRIVYFVGARLTKSIVVPENPIPLRNGFVSVMAEHLDDDVVLTTLGELENSGLFDWASQGACRLATLLVGRDTNRSCQNRAAFRMA